MVRGAANALDQSIMKRMWKAGVEGSRAQAGRQAAIARQSGTRKISRPFFIPTLAALLLIPLFCFLGYWQLDRAEEKRSLQAEYDRRADRPPLSLDGELRTPAALQFFRVRASGVYEAEHQVLWDNRIHHGVPGYHVITPLRLGTSDTRVLVNRGWVPVGADRSQLPVIDPPAGRVTVSGTAVVPHVEFMLGELDPLERARPTVWQQLDLARYAQQTGWRLQPVVLLLDPDRPGGYVREWARLDAGIAVHQGYAFQWFMLAATVLVVYVVLLIRAIRRGSGSGLRDRE